MVSFVVLTLKARERGILKGLAQLSKVEKQFPTVFKEIDNVVEELENFAKVNLLQKRSIIYLIGNVQRSSLILEKVFHVLRTNEVNVQMISQEASKVNISLTINDSESEKYVRALHSAFFESDMADLVYENGSPPN